MTTIATIAQTIAYDALSAGILGLEGFEPADFVMTEEDCEYALEQGAGEDDIDEIQRTVVSIMTSAKEEEEEEEEFDGPRGWYCSDRTCGATDCRRCYP